MKFSNNSIVWTCLVSNVIHIWSSATKYFSADQWFWYLKGEKDVNKLDNFSINSYVGQSNGIVS